MAGRSVAALLRGAADVAGARAIRVASSLVFNVVAARLLGVADFGRLSHAVSGSAVAHQLTDLGSGPAVGVRIARSEAGALDARVVRLGFAMKGTLIAVLAVVLLAAPGWGTSLFGDGVVVWGALLGVLTGVAVLTEYVVVGLRRTRSLLWVSVLAYTVPILVALGVVLTVRTVPAVVASWAGTTLVGLVVIAILIARGDAGGASSSPRTLARDFVRTALLLGVANLGAVLILRAPVIALGAMGQAEQAGLLGGGMAVVERAGLLGTAIGLSSGPALTRWTQDAEGFAAAYHTVRAGSEYALWAAAVVLALGPVLIPWILGPSYAPMRGLVPWLVPAVFMLGCFQMTRGLLDFGGWLGAAASAVAVSAAGCVATVVWWGPTLTPEIGAAVVFGGLVSVFLFVAVATLGREGGDRVRSVVSVVARDILRLGLLVVGVEFARGFAGRPDGVADMALAAVCALALVALTGWRRDLVPTPSLPGRRA